MQIPYERWYPAIATRRSHRRYEERQVAPDLLDRLNDFCRQWRPFPSARAVLVTEAPEAVFRGALGTLGKVKNAPLFVAFIGQMDDPAVQEKVGYTGEGVVLEAEALGLGTCWVGGFFRPNVAAELTGVTPGERVLCVTPVGYALQSLSLEDRVMSGFGSHHKRRPLESLVSGLAAAEWPAWVRPVLEAARMAPSAGNRQPWAFYVEPDGIIISTHSPGPELAVSRRLDCGIAMLHLEIGARQQGLKGKWDFLPHPQVARFRVTPG